MKKYLLLTSILALAACGGGSGGGGSHGVSSGNDYVAPRPAVEEGVAQSNAGITGLKSEIVVASNSNTPVLVRSASSQSGGVTYTSYRLDDVKLYTAEQLNNDHPTYINLNLDKNTGEINAVKMVMGGEDSGYIGRTINNEGNFTNTFKGPIFEYVPDGDDRAQFRVADTGQTMDDLNALATANNLSGGHWNRIEEQLDFKTYGTGTGLQYAEFGYFNPVYKNKNKELSAEVLEAIRSGRDAVLALARSDGLDKMRTEEEFQRKLAGQDYQLFAGGYAVSGTGSELDKSLKPTNSTSYTGTAIGRVYVSVQSNGGGDKTEALDHWKVALDRDSDHDGTPDSYSDDAGHDMSKVYLTNNATLEITSSGARVLNLPFHTDAVGDKFYDIRIDQASNGDVTGTKFTATDENAIAAHLRQQDALGLDAQGNVDMEHNIADSNLSMGFYGVKSPEEAAGSAYLKAEDVDFESSAHDHFTREYEVQAAWGMKKD